MSKKKKQKLKKKKAKAQVKKVKKFVKAKKAKAKVPAKTVQPAPSLAAPAVAVDSEKLMAKLMAKAGERGFVTEAEILHAMPNFEDDVTALEKVMDTLEKRG